MGESMQAHQTLRHFFPSRRWMEATSRPPSQEDALTSSLKLRSDARPVTSTQYLKLIEQKNPTICFTKRLRLEGAECRVCLSEFQEGEKVRNLKCKHTFHRDCLDKWLQQYWATCPLCRNQVLPDDVVAKYRELQNQRDYVFSFWDLAE